MRYRTGDADYAEHLKKASRDKVDRQQMLLGHAFGQEVAIPGVVVGIAYGDTCRVWAAGNQMLPIRLSFIEASESAQALGRRTGYSGVRSSRTLGAGPIRANTGGRPCSTALTSV